MMSLKSLLEHGKRALPERRTSSDVSQRERWAQRGAAFWPGGGPLAQVSSRSLTARAPVGEAPRVPPAWRGPLRGHSSPDDAQRLPLVPRSRLARGLRRAGDGGRGRELRGGRRDDVEPVRRRSHRDAVERRPAFGKRRIPEPRRRHDREDPERRKIFAAIHSVDEAPVADALVAKAKKGATVKVVMNGATRGKDLPRSSARDSPPRPRGAFEYCGQPNGGDGCISNAKGRHHALEAVPFSATEDENGQARKSVSWMALANMTTQTGANTFNNAVAIYGDAKPIPRRDEGSLRFDHPCEELRARDDRLPATHAPWSTPHRARTIRRGPPREHRGRARHATSPSQNMIHFDTRPEDLERVKGITTFCTVKVLVNHINRESFDRLASAGIEAEVLVHARQGLSHRRQAQRPAASGSRSPAATTGREAQVSNDELSCASQIPRPTRRWRRTCFASGRRPRSSRLACEPCNALARRSIRCPL